MDKFVITGGTLLQGAIPTNGSKNSALPALAAALLTEEPVTLHRIPRVRFSLNNKMKQLPQAPPRGNRHVG